MLPVQYTNFSLFAGLGVVGTSYISHGTYTHMHRIKKVREFWISPPHAVYRTCGYLRLAQEVAGESMQAAVDEVRTLPDYATKGEVSGNNPYVY